MPWKKLTAHYERQGTDLVRLWVCECGLVLRQDNISDYQIQKELDDDVDH